ncbi:MAG: GIY-YIG nuclease family protein [Schleiferiaceae bacterium]|nr:GIY-YIG nuclease family protein [Schleiferiaceae bacterium]
MYAVLDVETTGGKYNKEGITDIAVFLFDGHDVVDQVISLVNPERPIQPFVERLTGITQNMVKHAPKFYQLAKRIVELTEGAIIVGHNVEFDYRMLRLEFQRLGYEFERETLDTIELSQKLIPGLEAYGLEKVCKALGISNSSRHRAEGDARATLELLRILLRKDHDKEIQSSAHAHTNDRDTRSGNPFETLLRNFSKSVGIYYLFDEKGKVIYLGRSNNLKNRINKHFLSTSPEAVKFQSEIASVEVEETGSELLSRIKEFIELDRLQPKYNHNQPHKNLPWLVTLDAELQVSVTKRIAESPVHYFNTEKEAYQSLNGFFKAKNANPKLELSPRFYEKGKKFVTWFEGTEKSKKLSKRTYQMWSYFKKDQLLIVKGKDAYEKGFVFIAKGQVLGYGYYQLNQQILDVTIFKNALVPVSPSPYLNALVKQQAEKGVLRAVPLEKEFVIALGKLPRPSKKKSSN